MTKFKMAQFSEIEGAPLTAPEQQKLLFALNAVQSGSEVTVALHYKKQTNSEARKPGEDFVGGIFDGSLHIGRIRRVFRRKSDRALHFTVESFTRGNGIRPTGFVCMVPEGVTAFEVTGLKPAQVAEEDK